MERSGWTTADLDLFIPHQANIRIIEGVRERLGLDPAKCYVNIDRFGNTSSASIPIALDECVRAGRLEPGDQLAFAAFGGGATWGAATMTWTLPLERALAAAGAATTAREVTA
jgi:3-oxoacyl-[acyl-carrier-protein] synthase-3